MPLTTKTNQKERGCLVLKPYVNINAQSNNLNEENGLWNLRDFFQALRSFFLEHFSKILNDYPFFPKNEFTKTHTSNIINKPPQGRDSVFKGSKYRTQPLKIKDNIEILTLKCVIL